MKNLLSLQPTKNIPFAGGEVAIRKLSANAVNRIQAFQKKAPDDQMGIILLTVREGVPAAKEMSDAEVLDFAIEDLASLSTSIVEFSGLTQGNEKTPEVAAK